mgnify:CR=1 FL=1
MDRVKYAAQVEKWEVLEVEILPYGIVWKERGKSLYRL